MKSFFAFSLLFLAVITHAQKTEQYFDYHWKPCEPSVARFYAVIEKKGSLWHRLDYFINEKTLQMQGSYKDADCTIEEGQFHYYHSNGVVQSTGNYTEGKRQGLWLRYHDNKMMSDSATYEKGIVVGTRMSWHSNGFPSDSTAWASDGSAVKVSWFDNGNPSSAGRYAAGEKMHGKWKFFHSNGALSSEEAYNNGTVVSKQYYTDAGKLLSDTTNIDKEADFPGGNKAWQKYLRKNLYFPTQWEFQNAGQAIVLVDWTVDEDGNITDVRVTGSFHPDFDKIAVDAIRKSPRWHPAIDHNRKIKAFRRQPVTFAQQ